MPYRIADLSDDAAGALSEFLPVADCARFGATSRRFYAVIQDMFARTFERQLGHAADQPNPRLRASALVGMCWAFGMLPRQNLTHTVVLANTINTPNGDGLYAAVRARSPSWVRQLLTHGASTAKLNGSGQTLVSIAASHGDAGIVTDLLDAGAWVDVDALFNAEAAGHADILGQLVTRVAQMETGTAQFVLNASAARGHCNIVELLMDAGVPLADDRWNSTLSHAVSNGRRDVADLLLRRGASVSVKNFHGDSILHLAVRFGDLEMVKRLVEAGAPLNATDFNGRTAEDRATAMGLPEIAEWLMQARAQAALARVSDIPNCRCPAPAPSGRTR